MPNFTRDFFPCQLAHLSSISLEHFLKMLSMIFFFLGDLKTNEVTNVIQRENRHDEEARFRATIDYKLLNLWLAFVHQCIFRFKKSSKIIPEKSKSFEIFFQTFALTSNPVTQTPNLG